MLLSAGHLIIVIVQPLRRYLFLNSSSHGWLLKKILKTIHRLVGDVGFEPTTSRSQTVRATKLHQTPT